MKRSPGSLHGQHVAKRTWRDPKTGERLERAWYFLFYFAKDENGAPRRFIRRTEPPTDSKRVAEEQLRRALHGDPKPAKRVTVADGLDGYLTFLEANAYSTFRSSGFHLRWWRDGWTKR
jgi:hypothetical protein